MTKSGEVATRRDPIEASIPEESESKRLPDYWHDEKMVRFMKLGAKRDREKRKKRENEYTD